MITSTCDHPLGFPLLPLEIQGQSDPKVMSEVDQVNNITKLVASLPMKGCLTLSEVNLSHKLLLVLLSQIWKENTLLSLNTEEFNTADLRLLLKTIQRSVAQQLLTCKLKTCTNAPIE